MKTYIFLLILLFLCVRGHSQSNLFLNVGDLKLLTPSELAELQADLDSLFQNSQYDLLFNFETLVVNKLKSDSASQFQKLENTLRKMSDKFHKKNARSDKIEIIFHLYALINQTKKGKNWSHHLYQFMSFGENVENAKKIKLSQLKLDFNFSNENAHQNKNLLRNSIFLANDILSQPRNQFEKMMLGPLEIIFVEDLKPQGDSVKVENGNFYASPYIRFKLNLLDPKLQYRDITIDSASISLQISKNFDQISSIHISGKSIKGIFLDNLFGVNIYLESFSLSIRDNHSQALQGEAFFKATATEKKQLSPNLFLQPGANGRFSFRFDNSAENGTNGVFDFTGIENINLSVEIEQQTLLAIKNGKLDSTGTFAGSFSLEDTVDVIFPNYRLQIENMKGRFHFGLSQRPEIEQCSASFSLDGVEGLSSGKIKMHIKSDSLKNITAVVDSSSSYLKFNGFVVDHFYLQANLTELFRLQNIRGSATATHESFENEIKIENIEIIDGQINHFDGSGNIMIKDFIFRVEKLSYLDQVIKLDAKMMLNTTGIETWVQVREFTIDTTGEITINDISAELNKDPFNLKFAAAWSDSRFKGSFTGEFAGITVDGKLELGAAIQQSKSFNFAYLSLNASNKIGIPLGATGMKLTKLGGSIGYNYLLVFNLENFAEPPQGTPELDQYLIGCTMALCDVAGYCEVEGNVLIQFGKNDFQLILGGTVAIPRKDPIIESGIKLLYQPKNNTVGGELTTQIQIPPASGFIFNTPKISSQFNIKAQKWTFVSDHIEASVLSLLQYHGSLSFSGSLTNAEIAGRIEGNLSYHFDQRIDKSFEIQEKELGRINASLTLDLTAKSIIEFDPHEFYGKAQGKVSGGIDLKIESGIGSFSLSSSVNCDATLEIKDKKGLISGTAKVWLESTIWSEEYEYNIIKSI